MITDYENFVDELNAFFLAGWKECESVLGYVPEVRWQNLPYSKEPDSSKTWVRFVVLTANESQSSFCSCVGDEGKRRYTAEGMVFVHIFCPVQDPRSAQLGRKLATIAKNIFRGKSTENRVWFRESRINEMPPENGFVRYSVIANFQYDTKG